MNTTKSSLLVVCTLLFAINLFGQAGKPVPPIKDQPTNFDPHNFKPVDRLKQGIPRAARTFPKSLNYKQIATPTVLTSSGVRLKAEFMVNGIPLVISGKLDDAKQQMPLDQQVSEYLQTAGDLMKINDPTEEFQLEKMEVDELGQSHLRMNQYYQGIPVFGGQVIVHADASGSLNRLNGRYYPSPKIESVMPIISKIEVENIAKADLESITAVKELSQEEKQYVLNPDTEPELIIYHLHNDDTKEVLCWKVNVIPNVLENWDYFIDANTGDILHKINNSCTFYPDFLKNKHEGCNHNHENAATKSTEINSAFLGGVTANAVDMKGITRTINVYEDAGDYVMLDVGRNMYNVNSDIPDNMSGVILTLDAGNTNPANSDFDASYIFGNNNNWNEPKAVSAHYHAGECYEYFRGIHSRNSINGSGGNIVAFINVADTDGSSMGNAFWNGAAMFYGNGDGAFNHALQKSLDTGGHEMTHGVVGSSAGLIYQGQAGALNESFADVFGVMIDPENWQLGEDIVNPNVFSSGALRDLSDPNQGGSNLNHPGWQPDHMNEYQNLPNTPEGDNGGVHINSGIPNHAFYLFATSVGNSDARRVYYRALTTYLTNQAQFIDCRIAVLQSAADLFGNGSAQYNAAAAAFDQVGITDGEGSGGIEDIEVNPGEEYLLLRDVNVDGLFLFDGQNFPEISSTAVLSRPSVTDDGTLILFVATDNTIRVLELNEGTGQYEEYFLEGNPQTIWRNVAISKDGTKLAALTTDDDNLIFVYDFITQEGLNFEILNPTSQQGIFTDDVQYADFIEWDYSGEEILYDAYNVLDDDFGNTSDYWDVGLIEVWNNTFNDFGSGYVFKIFSGLPDNTGVGDPTFSKNSPNIIAMDFIGDAENFSDISIIGVDIEAGEYGTIFENAILGRPNYTIQDDALIFDALTDGNDEVIAIVDLNNDKITPASDAAIYITGGKWGVWFAQGERDFTSTQNVKETAIPLNVFPNPFSSAITVEFDLLESGPLDLKVLDLSGKQVSQTVTNQPAGKQKMNIDLDHLPSGTYFIKLNTVNEVGVVRVVKK